MVWMAVALFVVFMVFLTLGYPVAFSFALSGMVFTVLGLLTGALSPNFLRLLPQRWFGASMDNFILLAVPFFIFMGAILEKAGLAERLLTTTGELMGPMRGGLALAVILVGTLLAAATGVVAATVIVMGLLSLPVMLKYGYDKKIATGVITASGTMAQLIPPSIVLVILADRVGVGIGDLFKGALIPGLILSGFYALYIIYQAFVHPQRVPALPPEARPEGGWELAKRAIINVIPTLVLIFLVLGSIFMGIASPTEAGAVGAVGAAVLAFIYGNLTWDVVKRAARSTADITALVLMILFASTYFGLVFDQLGGKKAAVEALTHVPGGFWGFIIVSNIVVFFLGMNLEFIEIAFIVMPIFVPAAKALGVDLVWFSILMAINLNIAFISPPVGFSLFYLQSVAPPEVETADIHKAAFPFMGLQLAALVLVAIFPQTVLWLVNLGKVVNV